MKTFSLSPKVIFNRGSLESLAQFAQQQAFIVSDQTMAQFGYIDKVKTILEKAHSHITVWADAQPNPDVAVVSSCLKAMQTASPDLLIALGGGSVIDTAKAALYMNRELQEKNTGKKVPRPLFIAVPSTSGTGSEVTSFSVITDGDGQKTTLIDAYMAPDIAILDPTCTNAIPYRITVDTGLDVLTHALEAYVSSEATDFSDAMAEKAIKVCFEMLPVLKENLDNNTARERMHNASCLAGAAFENAGLGINHSLAHAIGGQYHLSHGRSNALLLESVMIYNAELNGKANKTAAEKYAYLATILGFDARTSREGTVNLIQGVRDLKRLLDVESGLSAFDHLYWEEFQKDLDHLAQQAMNDRCTATTPRQPSIEDLKEILVRAW